MLSCSLYCVFKKKTEEIWYLVYEASFHIMQLLIVGFAIHIAVSTICLNSFVMGCVSILQFYILEVYIYYTYEDSTL